MSEDLLRDDSGDQRRKRRDSRRRLVDPRAVTAPPGEPWSKSASIPLLPVPEPPLVPAVPVPPRAVPAVSFAGEILDDDRRKMIRDNMGLGAGRALACEQAGCLLEDLEATLEADPRFAAQIRLIERARTDDLEFNLYGLAMDGNNPGVALALLKIRNDRRLGDELMRQGRERLKNEGKVADAYAGGGSINMTLLSNDEFARFRDLHGRLDSLIPAEAAEYARLMHKMSIGDRVTSPVWPGPDSPPGLPSPAGFSPDSIQDVERLFGIDGNDAG